MRSALTTRVDRLTSRLSKGRTTFPAMICKLYDRDDNEIVGLRMGADRIARRPGETVSELLARARAETGAPMWAADYGVIDRCDGWSERAADKNSNADGPIWLREVPQ